MKQITFSVNFIFLSLFCCEVKILTFYFLDFFLHMKRGSFCCREFFVVAFFFLLLNSALLIFNSIQSSALMIVSNSRSLWNGSQLSVSLWCSASMCGCQVNVRAYYIYLMSSSFRNSSDVKKFILGVRTKFSSPGNFWLLRDENL